MSLRSLVHKPWAWVAVAAYSPYIVMAVVMSAVTACAHCVKTAWLLVPTGPGLLLFELSLARSGPGPTAERRWIGGFIVGALVVYGIYRAVRRFSKRSRTIFLVVLAVNAVEAWMISEMIRW